MILYEEELKRLRDVLKKSEKGQDELMGKLKRDMVNRPLHYNQGGIEVYDFIRAYHLNYALGNVVKYVARAKYKGNYVEDLKKAKRYLEMELVHCEEE